MKHAPEISVAALILLGVLWIGLLLLTKPAEGARRPDVSSTAAIISASQ